MTESIWADGDAYERFMGRWSRPVALRFVRWLELPRDAAWLDFGCGTGALTRAVLETAEPRLAVGCDRSAEYAAFADAQTDDVRARFVAAELPDLPRNDGGFDAAVSGLVLNFLPDPLAGVEAMAARVRPGGTVAAYVWDYADGMEFLRAFWDAARALDPAARRFDEGERFPLCRADAMRRLFEDARLRAVEVAPLSAPTVFRDFDDYWAPFLGGQGPAPGYVASLPPDGRAELRERIRSRLPTGADGTIPLTARVWAAKGVVG